MSAGGNAFGYKKVYNFFKDKASDMLMDALSLEGIEFRFNVRSDAREVRQGKGGWMTISDRKMSHIRNHLSNHYGIIKTKDGIPRPMKWTNADWIILLESIDVETEVDPFLVWLQRLPEWDKKPRIDLILHHLFEEHSHSPVDSLKSDFGKWASRFMFIASVQRAFYPDSWEPKDQIHTKPLFVGEQGIGKSSLIASILPANKGWVNSNFMISDRIADMIFRSNGMVICECAEMAGLTAKNLTTWMAFLTSRHSRDRLVWRKNADNYVQRSIFVGTTNELRCIPTTSGGWRRDLPVLLGHAKGPVEPYIIHNQKQLWAEAKWQLQKGVRAEIPYEMREKAGKHVRQFRKRNDPVEDAVTNLPAKFANKTTTELIIISGLCGNVKEVLALNPNTVYLFIDTLSMYGVKPVKFENEQGRIVDGWEKT